MSAWLPGALPDIDTRHARRSTYQAGCRCVRCRAAEAAYRQDLRRRKVKGVRLLGVLVSALESRRRIRQLLGEDYTKTRIAQMAGWRNGHVQVGRRQIRLSTHLRIQRVARFAMLEGAGTPPGSADLSAD